MSLPPYLPGNGPILIATAESGYRVTKTVPAWRAKMLFEQGLAKPAAIRILYPRDWPLMAEVQYGEDIVVIERSHDPAGKPPVNPYIPGYLTGGR